MSNIKCSACKLFFESIKKPNGECYKNCDKCREKRKEYYKLNAKKIKEHNKEYQKLNAEKKKEYDKEYRKLNAEKIKECKKEYQKYIKNNIKLYLIHHQRKQINRCFKSSLLNKNKHSIEYLGCDIETFINHFQNKIDYFNNNISIDEIMTFHNIHIDHINPISKFNLDDENEFLKCSHYTNMQPLLIKDNLEKSNKWNDDNEIYWNKKIINNDDYNEIYLI